jgi:hypothetical protein
MKPSISGQQIENSVYNALMKALETLPKTGEKIAFDPAALEAALQPPAGIAPLNLRQTYKEIVTTPPPVVEQLPPASMPAAQLPPPPVEKQKTSLLLPLLVAGAVLLTQ